MPSGIALHASRKIGLSKRLLRIAQIASTHNRPGLIPASPATIWRWAKAGKFPKPFKIGAATTVWDAAQVDAFIKAQQEGAQ